MTHPSNCQQTPGVQYSTPFTLVTEDFFFAALASQTTAMKKESIASLSDSVVERTLWTLTMGKPRGSSSLVKKLE